MKLLNVSTANKAIGEMVMRFEKDQKEIQTLRDKSYKLETELNELKRLLRDRERLNQEISTRINSD